MINLIKEYLEYASKEIDSYLSKYDSSLLVGDFYSEPTEETQLGKVSAKYIILKYY